MRNVEERAYPEHEAVPVWAPSLRTGVDGSVRVPLKPVESGARYVVRALVQTSAGGIGEATRTLDLSELGGTVEQP